MPIKGVTDNITASFPQIGTLHKGAARTQEDLTRNRPGRDLEGFRFTSDYPSVAKAFFDTYGPEPRLLDVYLLHPGTEANLSSWRELWVAGGLRHRCDGETCSVWLKPDGTYSTEPVPCPGPIEHKTQAGKTVIEQCKPITRLKVFLRDLRRAGYVLVQSSSLHDAIALTEQLAAIADEARGNLQGVPMILSRHPHKISMPSPNGQRKRVAKSLLSLEISPSWIDLRLTELEAGKTPEVPQLNAGPTVTVEPPPRDLMNFGPPPDEDDDEGEFTEIEEPQASSLQASGTSKTAPTPETVEEPQSSASPVATSDSEAPTEPALADAPAAATKADRDPGYPLRPQLAHYAMKLEEAGKLGIDVAAHELSGNENLAEFGAKWNALTAAIKAA